MAKLKLSPIADDKSVKVAVELPASLHRDLIAYAEILGRESGQPQTDPVRLIVPMLERSLRGSGFCEGKAGRPFRSESR